MKSSHGTGYGIYLAVFAALLVLTGATVAVSYVMNVAVALLIASLKASLVALFFMHLKFENKLVWAFALVPIFFLVLIVGGTISDTLYR
jgi:cytochrome c oxidase subunit 4